MECVSECPTRILDYVEALVCRLSIKGARAKVLENDHLTGVEGGLKTLFWELETQKLASDHLTQPETGRLCIRHLGNWLNGRSVTGLTPFRVRKGWSVCHQDVHAHPRPRRSLDVQVKASKGELKVLENDHPDD
ncbi:hypothetical protein TNIN_93111 [Trichonephila inaurata madagascariensis]|uniref:Uncharacterized protein n=1 Tax=Trichonephila inaurata madagascariensis TaxID=2747483 RepID=A0A8X7CGG7_9ARAC|nr:hypothetical protein TNIN_93111 [Trichonephila inaurata madagascariensis]